MVYGGSEGAWLDSVEHEGDGEFRWGFGHDAVGLSIGVDGVTEGRVELRGI